MDVSSVEDLRSIQQALQMTVMANALNRNGVVVDKLLEGMQEVSRAALENSVNPSLGGNIDITV